MNRREGIMVGSLLLATFIGGVFAIPEQQVLNVFVNNFPQNEVRKVLDQNITATSAGLVFVTGIIDVSQFSQVTAFYKITFSNDLSPECLGGTQSIELSIGLEQIDEFPSDHALDSITSETLACAGFSNHGNLTLDVNGPNLQALIGLNLSVATAGTIRGQITLFLQR